jgi:hypothetical protein
MEKKEKTSIERIGLSQALSKITVAQGNKYISIIILKYLNKIKDDRP